jgi:hypothetical protein
MKLLLLVQLGCAPLSPSNDGFGHGTVDSRDGAEAPDDVSTPLTVTGPYRGLWAPSIARPGTQSMEDPSRLVKGGFNTVAVPRNMVLSGPFGPGPAAALILLMPASRGHKGARHLAQVSKRQQLMDWRIGSTSGGLLPNCPVQDGITSMANFRVRTGPRR